MKEILKTVKSKQTIPTDPLKGVFEEIHRRIIDMSRTIDCEITKATEYLQICFRSGNL